ncbi:MAG: hypothetical protein A2286_13635 [Gammaproteobacteria bacterium RIFOXYA12_FULL_61_12]|nr:MAG: hypothetical protein A2514_03825 [Gammaproteobacteria bacterium RIFOXYD12_FULL_61_37]OGT93221.1 MAG: hypothetical protein A2286_13635 [Gammaproteobacteria bacterium RIFOXYA12_FULL_61_12]
MSNALMLDRMSLEEKMLAMEAIWDDLCHQADEPQSPSWHAEVLAEREAAIAQGEESFEDWEAAKRRIRDSLS